MGCHFRIGLNIPPRPVSCVAARKFVRRQSWEWTHTRYSLVVDDDVKKPTKQTSLNVHVV